MLTQSIINQNFFEKEEIPEEIKKEIKILFELGLEDYEIEYILYLKTKEKSRLKWRH